MNNSTNLQVRQHATSFGAVHRQLDTVRAEVGQPSGKTMADRRSEMTDVLTRAGCDPAQLKDRPGYGEIVKLAGAHQPTGAQSAFVVWKMCSSLAHGELRGLLAYLPKTTLGSPSPGMRPRATSA